jgi:hypothetical protein
MRIKSQPLYYWALMNLLKIQILHDLEPLQIQFNTTRTSSNLIKPHQRTTDQSVTTAHRQLHSKSKHLCRMGKPWTSRGLGSGSLLLLIMLCGAVSSSSSAAVCNAGDKAALLTFKGQLIDKDNFLAPWKTTTDCCTWPVSNSVTC